MVTEVIEEFINQLKQSRVTVKMYIFEKLKKNNHYLFYRPILSNDVQEEVGSLLLVKCKEINAYNELVEFNPVLKLEGTYEGLEAVSVDGFNIFREDIADTNNVSTNMNELDIKNISGYMIELECLNKNIKIFRRYTNAKTLKKRAIPYRIFENSLGKLDEELFFIDNIVDFAIIDNTDILIFDRYSFEILMNYKDNYVSNLNIALEIIEQSCLINNYQQFKEDAYNNMRIARKFTNVMKESSIDVIVENIEKVKPTIEELELPIEFIDGQFIYEDKTQLYLITQLLSDDFARTLIGGKVRTIQ